MLSLNLHQEMCELWPEVAMLLNLSFGMVPLGASPVNHGRLGTRLRFEY